MAATSLAEQLKNLTVPQTAIYTKEDTKKPSLLFDPKEAALKDRDTFYEIGISGLRELINLYEGFRYYEDSLFSLSSKDFERAIESKEVNANLNLTIEKFLLQLSPYLMLQSAHKTLEWLVNRYQIQRYNEDGIMALILPYHETKIFVRFIQIMDLKTSSRWHWLKPLKKPGIPLAKQVLFNQCVSNHATLQFIAKTTTRYVTEFGDRASQLNTVFAFFCSTAIGAMHNVKKIGEPLINALLPTVMKAIESPILDFRSSAYIIVGFLTTKASLKQQTHNEIVHRLITSEFDLTYDVVMLVNLMYTNQQHMQTMTNVIGDISAEIMNVVCSHLKKLIENKISVQRLVMVFLKSLLPKIQSTNEDFIMYHELPEMLIEELDLKAQDPEGLIECVINSFKTKGGDQNVDEDNSDIEIIEEDDFTAKIFSWYSAFLRNLEVKYPEAFDKVIKEKVSSTNKLSKIRKKQLSKILGFKPAIAHKVGDNYLFENLNHVNPDLRVEAVKYISKEFETLKLENIDFLKDSITNRLKDDNIDVVMAALSLPIDQLTDILNDTNLTDILVSIVRNKSHKWRHVVKEAICKFCSLEALPVNQETILALVPYLFPNNADAAKIAWHILNSTWGQKVNFIKNIKGLNNNQLKDNYEVLMQIIFKTLFEQRKATFDDVLDIHSLNKNSTLDICTFLMLKSCTFKNATISEMSDILSLILEAIDHRSVVSSTETDKFSMELMPELIKVSKHDQLLFEFMAYIFTRIIEDVTIQEIPKPWCNVLANPELVLIRRLYEICLSGCSIPTYSEHYAKLLQKLLHKICNTPRERCEFVANIAFGHILYAADPKDVIGPELQLRSLKLLKNFIAVQENEAWLYDSDVIMLLILLDLNHPIAAIRQCVVEVINNIQKQDPNEKIIYVQLIKELMTHSEELLLDHEQILQVVNTVLTGSNSSKIFKKNCLLKLTSILVSNTPAHIKASFLKILDGLNSVNSFTNVVSALSNLEDAINSKDPTKKQVYDNYESNIMKNIYSHINETTAPAFSNDGVWRSIEWGLKQYKECILEDGHNYTSPCSLIMKQVTEDVFKKIPKDKTEEMITLIASAGTYSGNPNISSLASKVIRKVHIDFSDFKRILENMLNVSDPAANVPKKKKSTVSMLSYQLTETDEWRLGVTLLEFVQTKKKMSVGNDFVQILFQLLNKCLRFEEQSYVEYTKQLILSSLWYFCKKSVDDSDSDQVKSLKSLFNVELVVQCIRGTQNPQTHHHALILLSHAAYMLPEQVLHHIMEIFTFMGSSVLRHDDAYSFQIITKIIETLVPILVKLDKPIEHCSPYELLQLRNRVVPVLRIFADVVLHVPEHRRLPLYKKLIETLGPNHFLWVFIALLLETHISHFNENKDKRDKRETKTLADQESPINRLDFGQSILLEFAPEVGLHNLIQLILYVKSLPLQKDEDAMDTDIDPKEIFSVNGHTAVQLRHYKYITITFMNTCLSSSRFIQHASLATDTKAMETNYKTYIINILTFIQSISKMSDDKTAKYWRVMLHHSYDLLDITNNLLSAPMFVSVIRGLLKHNLQTVRRKAMELLNTKIQFSPEMFEKVDNQLTFSLLPELLDIVSSAETKDESLGEVAVQELELNQQTALLSLKLLTRMLAGENREPFKPVLEKITQYTCNLNMSGNVMASVVLCLAELCSNLKAHALASLRKFMPALIKVLKKQRQSETPELVLLSTVTAISKIVESLPLFLSPYLQKILYEYSILLAKWLAYDQECTKVSAIVSKLTNIKKKIAGSIPPRVLIPVANETHQLLLEKENFSAIGPVMSVLADTFANVTTADFTALRQDLTTFFINALQLRSDAVEKDVSPDVIDKAEDEIVNALVCLVLKLSETHFRPFYFKIYDWAIRTNVEGHKDRVITFYRLSAAIADKLRGLFVLFAGHFVKNAAELLDASNNSKTEDLFFDNEDKCILLINYIIKTLHIVFLYDSQSFLNKDRFETLMQPVVDQLENTLGGIESLKTRAAELLIPCIAQFAVATADDSLWKLLNYQILLKTRHNDAEIRLLALDCLVAMASQLGTSWLPLLAESVPFLAELLEDGDVKIETSTKNAIRKLEQILEEPLEKYF